MPNTANQVNLIDGVINNPEMNLTTAIVITDVIESDLTTHHDHTNDLGNSTKLFIKKLKREHILDVYTQFSNVPLGDPTEPEAEFVTYSIDDGHNAVIYDNEGNKVNPPGKILVITDIHDTRSNKRVRIEKRRKKMRLVLVVFFTPIKEDPRSTEARYVLAWQGDNNILHLYQSLGDLFKVDPMLVYEKSHIKDQEHRSWVEANLGTEETFDLI